MASIIPIENVYYLFCYAWRLFPQGRAALAGAENAPDLQNLLAKILRQGVERLLKRGVDRGYVQHSEDLSCLRGRIQIGETIRRNLLHYGRAHCAYDELSSDVLHNQIIKTTMVQLAAVDTLDPKLAHELRVLARALPSVSSISLRPALFRRVQLHRNLAEYRLLLRICELVFLGLLPNTQEGSNRFLDLLDNEVAMSAVYEEFIRSFANHETVYRGGVEHIRWDTLDLADQSQSVLPIMKTDVTLRTTSNTLVVEAKFYKDLFSNYKAGKKLRSLHLYQLFSYLKNLERRGGNDAVASGLLLYPTVLTHVDEVHTLRGHKISVCTLNLNQPWAAVASDLRAIVERAGFASTANAPELGPSDSRLAVLAG